MSDRGYDMAEPPAGGGGNIISQLPSILWQRRWYVILPLLIGAALAITAALLLPTQYRSTAILLVQAPSLPADVVGADSAEFIDRRIERIRQQVVNRPALVSLIEGNQLYAGERGRTPLSQIIEEMRGAITLTPTSAEMSAARPEDRTIAFQLSYTYMDAVKAQAITQRLMERIVELNSSTTSAQKTQAVQFLDGQAKDVQRQVADLERQIAALNARYGGVLSNSGVMMSGGGSYDVQIAALQRENSSLVSQRETVASSDTRDPVVVGAETQLAAARAVYADSHPDVVIARQRLAEARQLARGNVRKLPVETLDRQIAFNNSQIAQLQSARAQDRAQAAATLGAQARAPLVQQQAAQLQQRRDGFYKQYENISARLLAARAGVRADDEQMGERLLVVDPPVIPDSPVSPNRPLILAAGVAGGLGLGLVLAFAIELFLGPIRDPGALVAITGARPLAMVPMIAARSRGSWWSRLRIPIPFRRRRQAV